MVNLKKQSFLQGAFIIAVAHIIVKVIGAAFKIPLARFVLGPDGMGIYNTSYTIYNWLFVVSTAGLPVAISKMISESTALSNHKEAYKIFKVSSFLLFALGAVGAVALIFGANFFARLLKTPSAYYALLAMAPGLFFVAIMSVFRGYFQGLSNMIPTAISEIIEASGKLVIGLILGLVLLPMGKSFAAAGAILGVSTGTILGALFLYIFYIMRRKSIKANIKNSSEYKEMSAVSILKKLIKIAVPITLGASVFTLTTIIDVYMIMDRLAALGYNEELRKTMYGYYSGYAVTMFNLPATIVVALSISIVPAISGAFALKNKIKAQGLTLSALRITILFALPCAVGLSVLSKPILAILYDDIGATTLLAILAYAVLFVSIVMVSNAILQATGKVWIPVINMLIGGIVKIVVNYILVSNPQININGAPIGTNLCYITVVIFNLIAIKRILLVKYKISDFLIYPLISVLSMGIVAYVSFDRLFAITNSNLISLGASITASGIVYLLILFLLGGIKKEDVLMLPKGDLIAQKLISFKLIKK